MNLIRPDFDVILQPLREAEKADPKEWPATSFLGEIRVRYKDGRRGTTAERESSDGRRSSTVDRRGLCVRDNGRPMDSLNLNSKCDREEFWARFNDLGGDRR